MSAIRSWGIPDEFPLPLAKTASATKRDRNVWLTEGGHYGHCNVPGNDHWDPGAISTKVLFAAAPKGSTSAPKPASVPTVSLANVVAASKSDPKAAQGKALHAADVKPVEAALKAEGLLSAKYASDGSFGTTTVTAYAAWQRKLGFTGKDADGIPGKSTLAKLGAKHGFKVK
jgi:hypothetical protein